MSDEEEEFHIRIVDKDGDGISNREVSCFYHGILSGSETRHTDDDGWCSFPTFGHSTIGEIYSVQLYDILVLSRGILLSSGEDIHDGAEFSFTVIDGEDE
jgi:hypothetical protein